MIRKSGYRFSEKIMLKQDRERPTAGAISRRRPESKRDVDIYTIIFLALAVFIFLRLRNVLGQRTGNERPPPYDRAARNVGRRPLVPGALSEDIAQTQEDEDGQRQEDDGVNIHVAFAFWSAPANGSGGRTFPVLFEHDLFGKSVPTFPDHAPGER